MFIAHLPAGYVAAAAAQRCGLRMRGLMAACLVGSLLPDFDLFWCYLVDGGRVHHHLYWTHWPVLWLGLLLVAMAARRLNLGKAWAVAACALCATALLHIGLDGVAGDIPLFAPWSMKFYALTKVEALYSPWWLNFVLHWSMLAELAICAAALAIFLHRLFTKRLTPHDSAHSVAPKT